MAKLKSLLKIEGTLGGITFYKTKDGNIAREKGGVSRDKILHDPRYKRTRENMAEFKIAAGAGKLLRDSITCLLNSAKDSRTSSRLTQVMMHILKKDATGYRGMRSPAFGLNTTDGKELLKSFNFNLDSPLSSVLFKPYSLDLSNGAITLPDLLPLNDLAVPEGATHVSFTGAMLNIDFGTRIYDLKLTNVQNFAVSFTPVTVALNPANIPAGSGIKIFFLKVDFYQEVNSIQYSLRNGAFNSLSVIDIV